MQGFEKRRGLPHPGSIPAVLDMFRSEVRFYRRIAPVVGIRVPACYDSVIDDAGTWLLLEDLSGWREGADPVAIARTLAELHTRWQGKTGRWPWLRPVGAGADLVEACYAETWPSLSARASLSPRVRELGERLVGRVAEAEAALQGAGAATLCHGDISSRNVRTSPAGELAVLDWEDVSAAPGVLDLAWLLVSSVEPVRWDETISAYGSDCDLGTALPGAIVQGLLSLDGSVSEEEEDGWGRRLDEATARLAG